MLFEILIVVAGFGLGGASYSAVRHLASQTPAAIGQIQAAAQPPKTEPAPPKVGTGAAGATPVHYRAFSLLSVRTAGDTRFEKHLADFRKTAKTIRDERDPVARDAALKVLDHLVGVAQAYADVWHDTPEGRRAQLRNKLKPTLLQLHQALKDALATSNSDVANTLAVEQRFVEIRYGEDTLDYGLTSDPITAKAIPPFQGEMVGYSVGTSF